MLSPNVQRRRAWRSSTVTLVNPRTKPRCWSHDIVFTASAGPTDNPASIEPSSPPDRVQFAP